MTYGTLSRPDTSPLTAQLLDDYRDARTRTDRPALEPETLPQAPGIEVGQRPVFRDAISGGLTPGLFTHFWIEAGTMSSSASHSQLELPRGGNRFFGYQYNDYGADHVTIGYPRLTPSRSSVDRSTTHLARQQSHGANQSPHAREGRIRLPPYSGAVSATC